MLEWDSGPDNGSPIIRYIVEYRQTGGEWTVASDQVTTKNMQVTDLEPGKGYRFRATAVNAIGTSLPGRSTSLVETKEGKS